MNRYKNPGNHILPFIPALIALAAGAAAAAVLILFTAKNPQQALGAFFTGPFSSSYFFGNMLNTAALLGFAGAGAALALKAGTFNLGGEGQIYASGFVTAVIMVKLEGFSVPVIITAALLGAAATGALMGLLPGLLKGYKNISEILTSFLLSGAIIPVIDYLVTGPFRDQGKNLLATPMIAENLRLPAILPPSQLTISFFIAIAVSLITGWLLNSTSAGYRLKTGGAAPLFAAYSGYSRSAPAITGMTLSGALHGITGFFAITGTYYTCHQGFYAGMGWNALAAALIAGGRPQAVFPAALLLGYLTTASDRAVLTGSFAFDATGIIQAAVFFCITIKLLSLFKTRRSIKNRIIEPETGTERHR